MLIIHRRDGCCGGMGRYHGSGMVDKIARTLFSSGIKKAISSGTSSAIAHKVADAVVNGATSTSKKVADAIVKKTVSAAVNTAIDSLVNKVKKKKRPHHQHMPEAWSIAVPSPLKRKKIDIDSVIDGSGIVYD